jgi:hypothetical protein
VDGMGVSVITQKLAHQERAGRERQYDRAIQRATFSLLFGRFFSLLP